MIAGVVLAVLVADGPVAVATPEPRTIIRVKASPVCSVLRELVVPLAVVQDKNKMLMAQIGWDTKEYQRFSDSVFRNGQILHSSNIDAAATTVLQNLALMDSLLAHSWEQSPAGKNPKVDALRQRVQNIVDLQRAVANRERQFGGFLPDSDGMDSMAAASSAFGRGTGAAAQPPSDEALPKTAVQVAAGSTPMPAPDYDEAQDPERDARISAATPAGFSAKTLTDYSFASLERSLRSESAALVPPALAAYRDCVVTEPAGLRN